MLWAIALAAPEVEAEPFDAAASCVQAAGPVRRLGTVQPAERMALVVGVPCHADPSIPSLQFSSTDAERVGTALAQRGYAVHHLTTTVTREDFEHALAELQRSMPRDGELVVYFSGHGVIRTAQGELQRYLVFSDADLGHIEATGLSLEALEARVQRIPGARRTVIQDTCYAAGERGKGLGGAQGAKALSLAGPPLGSVDTRLYASQFYEIATEEPSLGGSVYTAQLLRALDEPAADLDGDGCVGLLEAHASAAPATVAWRQGYQHPAWEGALDHAQCGPATRGVLVDEGELRAVEPGVHGQGRTRTRVEAGEWTTLTRRRTWGGFGGLGTAVRSFGSAPVAFGGEVGLQLFHPGWTGWIGVRGAGSPPLGSGAVRFTAGEGTLRLGVATGGRIAVGPVLELGALVLQPRSEGAVLPSQTAPLAGVGARIQGGWGPVYVAGELGLGATLDAGRAQAFRVIPWPTVVGVLGIRL